nr:hypothetical protein [Streptomyces alboniger]
MPGFGEGGFRGGGDGDDEEGESGWNGRGHEGVVRDEGDADATCLGARRGEGGAGGRGGEAARAAGTTPSPTTPETDAPRLPLVTVGPPDTPPAVPPDSPALATSGEARGVGGGRGGAQEWGRPGRGTTSHGAADPVKALMHRHRDLCARAVDPLEIAAGLEAHGVTDRAAARYRHRDVFALAEEMYARVPRDDDSSRARPGAGDGTDVHHAPQVRPGWALFALLPGAACAAAVAGAEVTAGATRAAVTVGGALAVALALRVALRDGPLRAATPLTPATRAWVCWLIAYALLGDGLLTNAVAGGPDGPGDLWQPATATALGLTLAVAPATWCARLFAARARGRLVASRGLDEFAASVRPLLLGIVVLFLAALGVSLAATDAAADAVLGTAENPSALTGAGALGALLLLVRLLAAHGFARAPALLLGAAGACEVAAPALVFAGRLPGCDALAAPVTAVVDSWGPGAVPAAVCGAAALALLIHAARTLTLASAHAGPGAMT